MQVFREKNSEAIQCCRLVAACTIARISETVADRLPNCSSAREVGYLNLKGEASTCKRGGREDGGDRMRNLVLFLEELVFVGERGSESEGNVVALHHSLVLLHLQRFLHFTTSRANQAEFSPVLTCPFNSSECTTDTAATAFSTATTFDIICL